MASDISRKTFDAQKHYSGVLMQQGRVLLDADWNEQLDIEQYRLHTETVDVIGAAGVPKKLPHSFEIIVPTPVANDVRIREGRLYVGGLLCEQENEKGVSYFAQPYYPSPDTQFFSGTGADRRLIAGTYIVYLEAWQRDINHWDDPELLEVALGGADTTTRLQTVWQVKLLNVGSPNNVTTKETCETTFTQWDNLIAPPSGKLTAKTQAPTSANPCLLPPSAGYLSLENQLYRIEVQKGGTLGTATFKWSRDNATVESAIENIAGNELTVVEMGKDEVLNFAVGKWVEIVTEASTLKRTPQSLRKITAVNVATRKITVDGTPPLPIPSPTEKVKLRRWDQAITVGTTDGIPTAALVDIEDGIQVQFSSGTYQAGDYWLIPARTATGAIEWAQDPTTHQPLAQAPHGTQHVYTRLALVKVAANGVTVDDCRHKFPALTDICAEDICYDNRNCSGSQATTVQQALDELCRRRDNCCTYTVVPGLGWEKVFDLIGEKQDAHICFQIGDYPLRARKIIRNKGNLKITGCGQGTRITAPSVEAALVFDNCTSILMRDLYAETGVVGLNKKQDAADFTGTLTFFDCPTIDIEHIGLKCGSGMKRTSACLTVKNNDKSNVCSVNIQHSKFSVGYLQQGILVVNARRVVIENNEINVSPKPASLTLAVMLKDRDYLANIRSTLIYNTHLNEPGSDPGNAGLALAFGNFRVFINTNPLVSRGAWQTLLKKNPPNRDLSSAQALLKHLEFLVYRLLTDPIFRDKNLGFGAAFSMIQVQHSIDVGARGITIGGTTAQDIHIHHNAINGFLQGIHVGLSHYSERNVHDSSEVVTISDNVISLILPSILRKIERHGIFVGNCKSLIVENNNIQLRRLQEIEIVRIEGIKVWGKMGERLMVTKNHVRSADGIKRNSFDVGIVVNLLNLNTEANLWAVTWNMVPSKGQGVSVTPSAIIQEHNRP